MADEVELKFYRRDGENHKVKPSSEPVMVVSLQETFMDFNFLVEMGGEKLFFVEFKKSVVPNVDMLMDYFDKAFYRWVQKLSDYGNTSNIGFDSDKFPETVRQGVKAINDFAREKSGKEEGDLDVEFFEGVPAVLTYNRGEKEEFSIDIFNYVISSRHSPVKFLVLFYKKEGGVVVTPFESELDRDSMNKAYQEALKWAKENIDK